MKNFLHGLPSGMENQKGFSLVEIIIMMGVGAILVSASILGLFTFRNNIQYDILLNQIIESLNYSKTKALTSKLDSENQRSSYSVKFFQDRIVEFQGETYIEGDTNNIEYTVPTGLRLGTVCAPSDNGVVTFSPITGECFNTCTINLYKSESGTPTGSVIVTKYGISQAS